jgi:phosphorylcholine metabolism protein LicD
MVWTHAYPVFFKTLLLIGLPLVNLYHLVCYQPFLGTAAEDATHLEWVGNQLLIPWQYVTVGQKATPTGDKEIPYHLSHRFAYNDEYWKIKTMTSYLLLPVSLGWGSAVKGLSLLWDGPREHKIQINETLSSKLIRPLNDKYASIGIPLASNYFPTEKITSQDHKRRGNGDQHMSDDRRALIDIIAVLEEARISYWVDCGTCLGAYRYAGVIPWDNDIDIAILQPDSDNVRRALNNLDSKKYAILDWSSRDKPKTYLKVYAKGTDVLIDLYHYEIYEDQHAINYILSNENNIFMSDHWREREREYKKPIPYDMIFPLKRGMFDGIEVMVPNKIVEYLQLRYGENLDPVKIYNEKTDQYENDMSHPFWKSKIASFFKKPGLFIIRDFC